MTDIAIPDEQAGAVQVYAEANIARLGRWAQQADNAVRIADVVVGTTMCPQAYRNKPNEAAAAILAGAELGFDPMASLRAFDNIQGTPAPKAMTLRAVAQRAGHEIRIVESSNDQCIVEGRRKGDTEWQRSTWDVARAEQMPQYKSNPNWRTNRAAMLAARATSEVCRWIASDAIMGMPYSAEEIGDSTGLQGTAPTRLVTAADIVGKAVDHVTDPADGRSRAAMVNEQQLQDIRELFHDRGVVAAGRQAFVNQVTGREVQGLNELSFHEAEQVILDLQNFGGEQA
jgi:hypothetical protein